MGVPGAYRTAFRRFSTRNKAGLHRSDGKVIGNFEGTGVGRKSPVTGVVR
jgi:hypothetical protein